ncbi:hypothetical protein JCM14635_21790 [Megalodesulfovibrio paquesii]
MEKDDTIKPFWKNGRRVSILHLRSSGGSTIGFQLDGLARQRLERLQECFLSKTRRKVSYTTFVRRAIEVYTDAVERRTGGLEQEIKALQRVREPVE